MDHLYRLMRRVGAGPGRGRDRCQADVLVQLQGVDIRRDAGNDPPARRLFINDTKALVHTVDGTAMLVTPGIFKRYVQEHPEVEKLAQAKETAGWKLVQRAFEKQGLHRKTSKNERRVVLGHAMEGAEIISASMFSLQLISGLQRHEYGYDAEIIHR